MHGDERAAAQSGAGRRPEDRAAGSRYSIDRRSSARAAQTRGRVESMLALRRRRRRRFRLMITARRRHLSTNRHGLDILTLIDLSYYVIISTDPTINSLLMSIPLCWIQGTFGAVSLKLWSMLTLTKNQPITCVIRQLAFVAHVILQKTKKNVELTYMNVTFLEV